MGIPLRIVVRTKVEWTRMDAARFALQDDPTIPHFHIRGAAQRDLPEVWRRAFKMDFFEYRAALQAIAADSHRDVPGARITVGLDDIDEWLNTPGEEILVPTDDDDFFCAALRGVVDSFRPDTDVVIWPFVTMGFAPCADLEPPWRVSRSIQSVRFRMLFSNNWAIRKSYLANTFDRDEVRLMLAHHNQANEAIADRIGIRTQRNLLGMRALTRPNIRLIPDALSVYNTHPGSIFFLLPVLMSKDPVGFLQSLDLVTPVQLPEDLRPFGPYVRRLEALMSSLMPRK